MAIASRFMAWLPDKTAQALSCKLSPKIFDGSTFCPYDF
jgi:hypothetical protein